MAGGRAGEWRRGFLGMGACFFFFVPRPLLFPFFFEGGWLLVWDLGARCQRGKRGVQSATTGVLCPWCAIFRLLRRGARARRALSFIFVHLSFNFFFPPLVGGVCFWVCFGGQLPSSLFFFFFFVFRSLSLSHFILGFHFVFHFTRMGAVGKGRHAPDRCGARRSLCMATGVNTCPLCPRGRTARRASSAPRGDGRTGPPGPLAFPLLNWLLPQRGLGKGAFVRPSAGAVLVGPLVPRWR